MIALRRDMVIIKHDDFDVFIYKEISNILLHYVSYKCTNIYVNI